jgi:hypothetical protein
MKPTPSADINLLRNGAPQLSLPSVGQLSSTAADEGSRHQDNEFLYNALSTALEISSACNTFLEADEAVRNPTKLRQ